MIVSAAAATVLEDRRPIGVRWLLWVKARNRSNNEIEAGGVWTGEDTVTFAGFSDGSRTYHGAGAALAIGALTYSAGLVVQTQTARLAIATDDVAQMIRGYEPRLAPVEIHCAIFDDGQLVSVEQAFLGYINEAPIRQDAVGGGYYVDLNMVSRARDGTRTLPSKKSDASQQERDENDRGFQYADVGTAVTVKWTR